MKIEATEEELADLMRVLDAAVRRDGLPMASIDLHVSKLACNFDRTLRKGVSGAEPEFATHGDIVRIRN